MPEKNDNCYVEQKNYPVVRQTVGYQRFDTTAELMVLQQLYRTLRLYINFSTNDEAQKQGTYWGSSKEKFTTRHKFLINECWLALKLQWLTKRNCSASIACSTRRR